MVALSDRHNVTDFHFEDENLGQDKRWLHEFCDTLIDRDYGFTWQPSNGLRVETVADRALMRKMKSSGCALLVFALESASARVRNEIIRKRLDLDDVERAVSLAREVGLKSTCYFIIGLPGETMREARCTINYASSLARKGLDECAINIFSMLPGCELFNTLFREGRIKLNDAYFRELLSIGDLSLVTSWTEHITAQRLKALRVYGYIRFMVTKMIFYPWKMLRSISNVLFRKTDELKSERVMRSFLRRVFRSA